MTKSKSNSGVLASIIAETPAEGSIIEVDLEPETSAEAKNEVHHIV